MIALFDRRFPADLRLMAEVRRVLRTGLEQQGVPELFLERLVLVVDEVVSNSIEHGTDYRQTADPIRVRVDRSEEGLILVVDDVDVPRAVVESLASEFREHDDAAPSVLLERGRGMFLIGTYLEDIQVTDADGCGMRLQGRLQESRY